MSICTLPFMSYVHLKEGMSIGIIVRKTIGVEAYN